MLTSTRSLGLVALGLLAAGLALLVLYGATSHAVTPTFGVHGEEPNTGNASGIPYWLGAAQVSYNATGDYAVEHGEAINRWNAALPRDYLLNCVEPCDLRQYMVLTSSPEDLAYKAWFFAVEGGTVYSCKDFVDAFPELLTYRAFEFGHVPGNGDKKYTVICLNHSAYVNCTNCFDDYDGWATETQIKGIVHEMGHSLHLDEDQKGAMDDDWDKNITQEEANYVHFAYAVGHPTHRVRQALNLAGYSPGYLECLTNTDWNDLSPGPITTRAYCYVDVPGIPVNPDISSASGDGVPGPPPPEPYGEVEDKHAVLTGFVNGTSGTVNLSGCFEDRDGTGPLGHVFVQWNWSTATATGTADTWVEIPDVNVCLSGPPGGTPNSSGLLQLVDTSYDPALDSDGDGCSDQEELGDNATPGGLRDPFNPYDFYDTNGDGIIDLLNDVRGVIARWGTYPGGPPNPDTGLYYDAGYDRGPVVGSNGWNRTGPDGIIDLLNDIRGVIAQWNHNCRPAP